MTAQRISRFAVHPKQGTVVVSSAKVGSYLVQGKQALAWVEIQFLDTLANVEAAEICDTDLESRLE